jgi:hypothetical protein
MAVLAQWVRDYIRYNAFSMTAPQLSEALGMQKNVITRIAKQESVKCRTNKNKVKDFIMKRSTMKGVSDMSALTVLIELRRMALLGYTVEQIAGQLTLSTTTIQAKLKEHLLPVRWEKKKRASSWINDFIIANHNTMTGDNIRKHIGRSQKWLKARLEVLGIECTWQERKPAVPTVSPRTEFRMKRDQFIRDNYKTMFVEDIAERYECTPYHMADKIRRMGFSPLWKPKQDKQTNGTRYIKFKGAKKQAFVRPPAVYSNSPSPYGIATSLHN